jgi:hypothetical protein
MNIPGGSNRNFNEALNYATKPEIQLLWTPFTLDDALVDAPMMKRVLESMLYDPASPVQGFRSYFDTPVPFDTDKLQGQHMITAYWRETTLTNDYHFASRDWSINLGGFGWTDKEGSWSRAFQTNPYEEAGTFLSHYIVTTAPRHFDVARWPAWP